MTPDELSRIETELGITLPEIYRQAVNPYPIDALRGNTEWMLWDDADQLIALNKRLREGARNLPPWPTRFYATGEDAGGCSDAIDLDDADFGVFWFDRQYIDVGNVDRSNEKLDAWIERQIEESMDNLEGDGIESSMTPEQRQSIEKQNNKFSVHLLLVILACIVLFILARTLL